MGVIYKLKDEVVSFIVDTKKNDPGVSCRKLSELVYECFEVKVSKSSINTILKKSQLSSSVGRRGRNVSAAKKFTIPQAKKEQLSSTFKKFGFKPSEEAALKIEKKDKPRTKPKLKESPKVHSKEITQNSVEDTFKPQIIKDDVASSFQMAPTVDGEQIDHAGLIFLHALHKEMGMAPLFRQLFQKYVSKALPENFERLCDAVILLVAMGASFEDIQNNKRHAIWKFSGLDMADDFDELQKIFDTVDNKQALTIDYENKVEILNYRTSHFAIYLEDQTKLKLDTKFIGLWPEFVAQHIFSNIQNATTLLADKLISNFDSIYLYTLSTQPFLDANQFIYAMENVEGKRIEKIALIDENQEEITSFKTIPNKIRNFAFGIRPYQKAFGELVKATKWVKQESFEHPCFSIALSYCETKTSLFLQNAQEESESLRVITICEKEGFEPILSIVSNDHGRLAIDIVRGYLLQWPYFEDEMAGGYVKNALYNNITDTGTSDKDASSINCQESSPKGIFSHYVKILEKNLRQRVNFLDKHNINHRFSGIYEINGFLLENNDIFKVVLSSKNEHIEDKMLKNLIFWLNEGLFYQNRDNIIKICVDCHK